MTRVHDSNFNPAELPISTFNAATMLKKTVKENEKPYDKAVKQANNALVERWRKEVLNVLADNKGNVKCGIVWESWQRFSEGFNIRSLVEMKPYLVRYDEDQLNFWIEFFRDLTVKEIASYGAGVSDLGWFFLSNEVRIRMSEKKWEEVYSKSENPLDWERSNSQERSVLRGEIFPILDSFTMKRMEEKVRAVLQCSPKSFRKEIETMIKKGHTTISKDKFTELMKIPIFKNDTPYDTVVAKNMNGWLEQWFEIELKEDEMEIKDLPTIIEGWEVFYEGLCLKKYEEVRDQFPRMSDNVIAEWLKVLDEDIEDVHRRGDGTIGAGWFLLQNENKLRAADVKLEKVYLGDDYFQWKENASREEDIMSGKATTIFGENLGDYGMKVSTIFNNIVQPQGTGPRVN